MKLARLLSVALAAGVASAKVTGAPLEPVVNQIGRLPIRGNVDVPMKFAIVEYEDAVRATGTATVTGGRITSVSLTAGGSGYSTPPVVSIVSSNGAGTGARAVATIANGSVTGVRLLAGGSGYRAPVLVVFALPAGKGVTTLWSNDGTSVAGSQPAQAVSFPVIDGSYAALLGYTSLDHMAPLTRTILSHLQARVRVWYSSGRVFRQVVPDAPLQTILYADSSSYAEETGGVTTGGITSSMLADGAVTTSKLAAGAVTAEKLGGEISGAGTGGVVVSMAANDAQLLARGFTPLRSFPAPAWSAPALAGAPSPRTRATAIWTGSSMIVWGGSVSTVLSAQGGEFVPLSTSWSALPGANAPAARAGHTAVWTGAKMIVWGGATEAEPSGTATGGMFDEIARLWRATTTTGAPAGRVEHTATWTGDRMVVWGGRNPDGVLAGGSAFLPPSDNSRGTWSALSDFGDARRGHSAVWTGSRLIVWGGLGNEASPLTTGSALDPATGHGSDLPTAGAPTARFGHSAVWTGSKMIVWGGASSQVPSAAGEITNDGASYDPSTQTWTPLSTTGAPEPRFHHAAVWTGTEMIVFGGEGLNGQALTSAAAYNPLTNTWRSLPGVPSTATGPASVWSGQALLTFGVAGLYTLDPSPAVYLYGRF